MTSPDHPRPIWDRGDAIDAEMLAFTIGDDPRMDQRLVTHDLRGSIAHAQGLAKVGLISAGDLAAIEKGLEGLLADHQRGAWSVEAGDEDVHSAVERRLTERIGDAGKKLHTARSRNEQVAVDLRLWLRDAVASTSAQLAALIEACRELARVRGDTPLTGYTHLRPAMPSSVRDWILAHARALEDDHAEFAQVRRRIAECPLGSGAGYGLPVELARAFVAERLGFERPVEPVTLVQHSRGRAELAYVSVLESIALDLGKLAADLWLYSSKEFGFVKLPVELTTGSSLMPQKRNPDLIELVRAHARQVVGDRAALLDVLRDLPSGYHRDFQLIKPALFAAHDRMAAMLPLCAKLLLRLEFDSAAIARSLADPGLSATARTLEKVRAGVPFREAYRDESRASE
ncbi:MAG: argininosuccinate lyase [Planctomycetota bacterium]